MRYNVFAKLYKISLIYSKTKAENKKKVDMQTWVKVMKSKGQSRYCYSTWQNEA